MGRESSMRPSYEILAYVTSKRERVIAGPLSLYGEDEKECKELSVDIAKAMKADVVKMTNGDYLIIRV
ncbi:hypothetical protein RZN22_17035 [Bacillaceae bacterium S4-13-58]